MGPYAGGYARAHGIGRGGCSAETDYPTTRVPAACVRAVRCETRRMCELEGGGDRNRGDRRRADGHRRCFGGGRLHSGGRGSWNSRYYRAREASCSMTNADWWARVVQARTERDDLRPQRVWTLRKGEHEAVARPASGAKASAPNSCYPARCDYLEDAKRHPRPISSCCRSRTDSKRVWRAPRWNTRAMNGRLFQR